MYKHFTIREAKGMARLIDEEHMTIGQVARRYNTTKKIVQQNIEQIQKQNDETSSQEPTPANNVTENLIEKILRDKNNHLSRAFIAKRHKVSIETIDYVTANYKDRYAEMFSKPKEQSKKLPNETPQDQTDPNVEHPADKDTQRTLTEIAHYYNQGATWEELNGLFGLNNYYLSKLIRQAKAQGMVDKAARLASVNNRKTAKMEAQEASQATPEQGHAQEKPQAATTPESVTATENYNIEAFSSNELFKELQRRGYRLQNGKVYQKKTVKVDLEPIVNNGQYLHPVNTSLMSPAYTNEDLIFELHRRGFRIQDNSLYQITDIEVDLHKMVHPE